MQLFTVKPPQREPEHATADQHLKIRVPVQAGAHELGVAFVKKPSLLQETARQPYQAHFNFYRHPRIQPAIYSISIIGPYGAAAPGESPSRRRLFVTRPVAPADEGSAARQIFGTLMKRAYRRPVTEADFAGPLALFEKGRADGGFDAGIEMALAGRAREPELPLPPRARIRPASRPTRRIASAISSWRRGCRSSSGAAFRTTSCWAWR